MRQETTTRTLYKYDELPTEQAKEKAREWYAQGMVSYDWWECIYDDAETVGLKIKSFDEYTLEAKFIESAEVTADKIIKNHGESCETYSDATKYLADRETIVTNAPRTEDGDLENEWELDDNLDNLDGAFLETLQEDYRIMLRKEIEFMESTEQIEENIRGNEYEFTEGGKRA